MNSFQARISMAAAVGALVAICMTPAHSWAAAERIPVMENERFSVVRVTYPPGEHQAALYPPPGTGQIVTLVTPGEFEINFEENGKKWTEKGHMEAGKVWWLS